MILALSLLILIQTGQNDNPWSGFKEGSISRYSVISRYQGKEMQKRERSKTVAKVEGKTTVLTVVLEDGSTTQEKFGSDSAPNGKKEEKGTEVLEIDGEKVTCKIVVFAEEGKHTKSWLSDSVPGGLVKQIIERENQTTSIVLAKIREELTIGRQKLICYVKEAVNEIKNGPTVKSKFWYCADVPGWEVKTIITAGETEVETSLVEFSVKK